VCQIIKKNIKSDINALNDIVSDIMLSIDKNIGDEHLFNIRLILSELLINSIIHGNNNDIEKNILISLKLDDALIELSVKDEGNGFNYSKNLNPCEFCESGRGLLLVEGLSDQFIIYDNAITCIKYI